MGVREEGEGREKREEGRGEKGRGKGEGAPYRHSVPA
jgi:hypothetical protein